MNWTSIKNMITLDDRFKTSDLGIGLIPDQEAGETQSIPCNFLAPGSQASILANPERGL
jgi:hypothetical protein